MKKQMIFLTIAMLFSGLAMADGIYSYRGGDKNGNLVIESSDFEKKAQIYGDHGHSNPYGGPNTEDDKPECRDQLVRGHDAIDASGLGNQKSHDANCCEELLR